MDQEDYLHDPGQAFRGRVASYRSRGREYPEIRIRGEGLSELGYEIGDQIEVSEGPAGLAIVRRGRPYGVSESRESVTPGTCNGVEEYRVAIRLERFGDPRTRRELRSPEEVAGFCGSLLHRDREVFWSLFLDTKNHLNGYEEVAVGTVNAALVHPREIYKAAILTNAAALILAHNHPSGIPEPSAEDIEMTGRLSAAGKLLGIELLDHVIVGADGYVSLRERGAF